METIVSRTLSVHKEHELLLKLEAAGLNDELAQDVIDSKGNALAKQVVKLIQRGGFDPAESSFKDEKFASDYDLARTILGTDFISPEEVAKSRKGVVYTDEQITTLAETLPSEDVLKWCKDNGYAVMPAPPRACSLLDIRDIESSHFYSKTGGWYAEQKQKFAREDKTSFGWLRVKKAQVSNSFGKDWTEQNKLSSALERVPNVAEMSWFITTYFEVRGVRLFESFYVRTSSLDSNGLRVRVGGFHSDGLVVNYYWDDRRSDDLGLSAARK